VPTCIIGGKTIQLVLSKKKRKEKQRKASTKGTNGLYMFTWPGNECIGGPFHW